MSLRPVIVYAILLLLLFPLSIFAQTAETVKPFSLTRSSDQSVNLHFQLPAYDLERVELKGETLTKVKVADTPYLFIDETETLPVFSTLVAIPYSGGAALGSFNVLNSNTLSYKADFDAELSRERNLGRQSGSLYPQRNVEMSEPQILRDFRVVSINVYPFQYDQDSKKLIVNPEMDITINLNNAPAINEMNPPASLSRGFESLYRGMILNYDSLLTRDTIYRNPVMLVIYGNYSDSIYLQKVNEFVAWKKQKGYIVNAVSTATTGTSNTQIKNYIQTQYNSDTTRPDYLVLIGDTTGSMPVTSFNTYMDYEYTLLAGSDNLGDVVIGRISVETTEQLVNYVAKLMMMEKDIDVANAAWLNRMVLVGDTASSGISTVYTNQYISDIASDVNPQYTYTTEYSGSPSSTNINTAITNGVVFYNYRGYIGMSGWPNTMSSMFNFQKLFHAVFITCNTGTFAGSTSTTESVVRYGTSATGGGALTAIGMATSSTHTPMNNCLNVGIFHNLYGEGGREMGSAMLNGKIYLYSVYGVSNATQAYNFSRYCNLIGDPTASVYVGIPKTFVVDAPTSIASGTTNIRIGVSNNNSQLVAGASVTLTNSSGLQLTGFTNEYGYVVIDTPASLSGTLTLTVAKDDFKPTVSTITINASGGIVYDSSVIDDDTASGNGDGVINPGEQVNLYITVKNTTSGSLFLSGSAYCTDPYVTLDEWDRIEYNSIASNGFGENLNPVVFSVAQNCPDNHSFVVRFQVEGSTQNWTVYVPLVVRSGNLEIQSHTFVGATGNVLNPGNVFPLTISLKNTGLMNLTGLNAALRSYDNYLVVQDSLGYYGTVNANATVSNSGNTFEVYARGTCIDGMVIPLELYLYNSTGFTQTVSYTVTIGQTSVIEPLGQDAYGYFIFDQGDTAYAQCPSYQWIPIAPAEGGIGTLLPLTDPGADYDEGDQVGAVSITTVNLPFPFSFYGESYSRASISSNGFIAFGDTQDSDWRNWRLPGPGGPNPMLAVFWDDLQLDTASGVYTYYNSTAHYFVVQWYNVLSGYDQSSRENFQAILYDPVYFPTQTNDGQIKLQYKIFNNVDLGNGDTFPHGNFCTIGIKDQFGLVGLEYTFNNTYPTAAAALSNEKALFITTRPLLSEFPHLTIQTTNILDTNGNGFMEPGESANLAIMLRNSGLTNATNVTATLTSSDHYVTINTGTASYGTINAQAIAAPQTNYAITISSAAPSDYQIPFTLTINGSGETWVYEITLNVYTPHLEIGTYHILDPLGDVDGNLDPGETVTLRIPLQNNGLVASPAGSAQLNCSNLGITIANSVLNFVAIPGESTINLDYTLTASAAMSIGTLVSCDITATAGSYSASQAFSIEVGAPTEITIGTGTGSQTYPLDRYYNYSAHEAIYLSSEIGMAGSIKSLAYYKASGSDVNDISPVTIYMKHTAATSITTGVYSTDGYTQVYSGTFPNSTTTGWMEINLSPMFEYNGGQNLSILIVKGYQQWISSYAQWTFTNTGTSRARQERSDTAAPTSLTQSSNLPNLRLKMFPAQAEVYPPHSVAAAVSHRKVVLTWQTPISGAPITYKLFRNGSQLTTVNALSYTDLNVVNNQTYSYYLKSVYSGGESDASETVNATPIALPAQNLSAVSENSLVSLTWEAPSAGVPTAYQVHKNNVLISTETELYYYDVDVVNGTTYSYYVVAVYDTETSAATATVQGTPNNYASTQITVGTGFNVTTSGQNSPINTVNRSVHGQSVYLASELIAAGITGPAYLNQLGFYVQAAPTQVLPNFVVRMKHTTATNAAAWHTADGLATVYTNAAYQPVGGGYDMLQFSTPFLWNGVDNILVDTAFSLVPTAVSSGTVQYTMASNGYRIAWSNSADQTEVFTGGLAVSRRPNIKLGIQIPATTPVINVSTSTLNFGSVEIGQSQTANITVSNTTNDLLAGYFTLPAGYEINALRETQPVLGTNRQSWDRSTLRFDLDGISSLEFTVTFTPTEEISYNGNLVITSNAVNQPNWNVGLSGSGHFPTLNTPLLNISSNGSGFELSWNAIPNAGSYKVYKASLPEGPYTLIGTTSQLQYTDTTGDKAFYYIKATSNSTRE